MEDAAVAQFTEITGSSPETATHYLQLSDYNLQTAMQLYFENGAVDIQPEAPAAPSQRPSTRPQAPAPYEDESGIVHLDSDDEATDIPVGTSSRETPRTTTTTFEDDLAMARRLQEELYAGGDSIDGDSVRAPMARKTETLVGPGADFEDVDEEILEQVRARQRARVGRAGIFNQRDVSSSIWNDEDPASHRATLSRATGGASEASSKSSMLAEMYRPPFEIISRLPWDLARTEGREKMKWLLVNVQDPSIFDCQLLNRDLWKNREISDTIKEHFLFLQFNKDDERGAQYLQYYFTGRDVQDNYPHIAIVDPRTGEQVKVWSGPPVVKAPEFLMQLHEFLDRYSLDNSARNPVAKRKPEVKPISKLDTMTEEEMLEMALRNSLEGQEVPKHEDPDDLTRSIGDIKGKGKAPANDNGSMDTELPAKNRQEEEEEEEEEEEDPSTKAFKSIPSNRPHHEPAADPTSTTRIQFRHSSGRIIRRFALSDPVCRLYEWLKAAPIEGKAGIDFELVSMGQNLITMLDASVQDAGLKNGTVMVGYLED
ncbi:UBX domain protein Ubx2 [Ophidiomyces ophidiicola]|nr:UBX domain protein Ubx2 [Ophidiomyces ophidiicola]KAI1982846.1 UBX domain protein Ubx2 [Ophidiomyces ophidiicola]KAI1985333.1 UBX domain protein Ubx2 [Ophidiomyces ophidiicola]KAI2002978.1 UBX domain protein Ubx2 [Ophidiomyces ophidiicola]